MTAANFFTAPEQDMGTPVKMENVKQAPAALKAQLMEKTVAKYGTQLKSVAPATKASDLVGGYQWTYDMASSLAEDPSTIEPSATYTDPVVIYDADDDAGTIKIAGMFDAYITATCEDYYGYYAATIDDDQTAAYTSNYGVCYIRAVFHYEGDDTYEAGWYYTDPMIFFLEDGTAVLATDTWIQRVIASGTYAGYYLTPLWMPGSTMEVDDTVNGVMTYAYNSFEFSSAIGIAEDANYKATINNFAGLADNPVYIQLEEGRTWTAEQTVLFTNTNGSYVLYGTDGDNIYELTGTGTETVLTFDSNWTGYDTESGYWLGNRGAGTITWITDEFVYPGEEPQPEHAYYLIGGFNSWDQENMVPFVEEDGVFTLTYTFGGEFKVKDENGAWWGGGVTLTEENPSVTLVDGANLNLDQEAEYTLTIEDGVLTVTGFPAPQVVEYNDFFVCGSFNNWSQEEGLVELVANEEGTEFAGTVELEAEAEFKLITHNLAGGWKWFGGQDDNNTGYFLINNDILGANISLVDGANFRV
ncbi:MAG: hypothetical protein IKS64_05060, partial [Muribaculaceae bacterium]|nr:hypothetical protein [Muribaculaceae bacterium]